jgi:hypothetical protein
MPISLSLSFIHVPCVSLLVKKMTSADNDSLFCSRALLFFMRRLWNAMISYSSSIIIIFLLFLVVFINARLLFDGFFLRLTDGGRVA